MSEKEQPNLVVLTFEGQGSAEALYKEIEQLEKDKLVVLEDAVIIERDRPVEVDSSTPVSRTEQMLTPLSKKSSDASVRVKQTRGKKGKYAAVGGGIGLLAAAIFGGPIGLAAVATAGLGAFTAALKDFGVKDESIEAIKQGLQPGTSALVLLGRANDREALLAKLRAFDAKVLMTSLDPEVEQRLLARLQE